MSIALSELEQPHVCDQARSPLWATTGDWAPYGKQFTEDGHYVEHRVGVFNARDAIRSWITEGSASWETLRRRSRIGHEHGHR